MLTAAMSATLDAEGDSPAMSSFTMYSTPWCGYCFRLKGQLDREGIAFEMVDIEQQPDAALLVERVNDGNQTVPTLVFADGSALTNPSLIQVKARLAELEHVA
jgi:mycoredoxin